MLDSTQFMKNSNPYNIDISGRLIGGVNLSKKKKTSRYMTLDSSVMPLKKVFKEQSSEFGGYKTLDLNRDPYAKAAANIGPNPEKYAMMLPNYQPSNISIFTPISPWIWEDNGQKGYSDLVNERVTKQNLIVANQEAEWQHQQHNNIGNRFQDYRRGYEFKYTHNYRPNTYYYTNKNMVSTSNPPIKSLRSGVDLI
jgi:hypothetical protein